MSFPTDNARDKDTTIMSINEKGNLEEILPAHFSAILLSLPAPLTDDTFVAIKPILGGGAINEVIRQYKGGNGFLNSLSKQLRTKPCLSVRQERGACNAFRSILRGETTAYSGTKFRKTGFNPPTSQASPSPVQAQPAPAQVLPPPATLPGVKLVVPATAAPATTGRYKCFTCQAPFDTMQEVLDHKRAAHASYGTRAQANNPSMQQPAPVQQPLFTPKYGLDLRLIPDGRYAVVEPGKNEATYIIKRTTKRAYYRRGRFLWGATTRQVERIPEGRMELRLQRGDTKELIGEQNPASNLYHGEHEEAVKLIMADPSTAIALYGLLMKSCGYCGRSLTDPLSQSRGVGPDCWEDKHVHLLARKGVTV